MGFGRVAVVEHHCELVSDDRVEHRVVGRRPGDELAARKAARDEPSADTVVHDHFEAGAAAIAKDIDRAIEGIGVETFAAYATEAVEPAAEIYRGDADEDLQMGDQLEHGLTGEGRL